MLRLLLPAALLAGCARPEPAPAEGVAATFGRPPPGAVLAALAPGHPDAAAARDRMRAIRAGYGDGPVQPRFAAPASLRGDALARVFPGHRFVVLRWDEEPRAGAPHVHGRALGLALTLVLPPDGPARDVPHAGEYTEYGRMLADAGVRLATDEDARRIWNAFCEIHLKHWRDQGFRRIDETHWELGVTEIRGLRYAYDVRVGPGGTVTGARLTYRAAGG